MKIQWYYIGAMIVMLSITISNDMNHAAGCWVGIVWILAKKAFPTKEDQ